jgi:hypothetical protein
MLYPNVIQAALLLDTPFEGLDALMRELARVLEMKTGSPFTISEHRPGAFMRLLDSGDALMLSAEYLANPPDPNPFENALGSAVTAIYAPDMAKRVKRARAAILLEVSHVVLGEPDIHPQLAPATREGEDAPASGTPDAFHRRLDTLVLMARVASDHITPCAIHWTQSDQLLLPETFEAFASGGFPGPLTLHPLLFGSSDESDDPADAGPCRTGLRTFGARHWLGREVVVPPSTLPWYAAYETVLAFCAYAAMPGAEPIRDGDTFSPPPEEDGDEGGEIWRVHYRDSDPAAPGNDNGDATGGQVPVTELIPLRHDGCGFVAEDYARSASILAERNSGSSGHTNTSGGQNALSELKPAQDDERPASEGQAQASQTGGQTGPQTGTPSLPGDTDISGRSLRARLFGKDGREG